MGCKQSKNTQKKSERPILADEVTSKNETRVDSEVTADRTQVIKPSLKTGIPSDISDGEITNYVHKALKIFLPDYSIDSYVETAETLPPCFDRAYIMQVKSDPRNKLYPDPTGEFLNHSIQSTTDILHVCYNRDPTLVKFLYQKRAGRNEFITSPFHDNNTIAGSAVPCSLVTITQALHEEDPIAGIVEALGQIHSNSIVDNGFDGNDFLWKKDGNSNNFTIRVYPDTGNIFVYWEAIVGSPDGEVLMTDRESMKVHLELIQIYL